MVAEEVGRRLFVSESEAKERFEELLAEVGLGKTIAVMRDGDVVAVLSPSSETLSDEERREAFERFLEERAKWPRTNITRDEILASRHEGHRV